MDWLGNEAIKYIFVQALGVLGIIASIFSFQCRRHQNIMVFRTLNEVLFAVHYFFLGAYTGVAMNIIGSVRNMLFAKLVKENKSTLLMRWLFSAVFLIFAAFTWAGAKSILSGIAKVVSTFAYGSSDTKILRFLALGTSTAWLIYNITVGSFAGFINEFMTIVSVIIGIIRIDILKGRRKA